MNSKIRCLLKVLLCQTDKECVLPNTFPVSDKRSGVRIFCCRRADATNAVSRAARPVKTLRCLR